MYGSGIRQVRVDQGSRGALSSFFDPYSHASSNIYQFIVETRLCLAVPRPQAINLVSGLPTS
jgi:hypothetical protein